MSDRENRLYVNKEHLKPFGLVATLAYSIIEGLLIEFSIMLVLAIFFHVTNVVLYVGVPSVVLALAIVLYSYRLVSALARRFPFFKLYLARRVVLSVQSLVVVSLLSSLLLMVIVPQYLSQLGLGLEVVYVFFAGVILVPLAYAGSILTLVFTAEGLASLCFLEALHTSSRNDYLNWLDRGLRHLSQKLRDIGIATSSQKMMLAFRTKTLRGEDAKNLVLSLSEGSMRLNSMTPNQSQFYEAIRNLNFEADKSTTDGFTMTPTYRERAVRVWDFMIRSKSLLGIILFCVVELLSYRFTGKLIPTFPG